MFGILGIMLYLGERNFFLMIFYIFIIEMVVILFVFNVGCFKFMVYLC